MEVRRAVVAGVVIALSWSSSANAEDAGSSSTAAFPDTLPRGNPDTSSSARAGFPGPVPAQSASPKAAPPTMNQGKYPSAAPTPAYAPPVAAPQYGPPSAQPPPRSYQSGWGQSAYGAGYGSYGQPLDRKNEAKEPPERYVTLTISPVHLALPVLEATLEARLTAHFGVAGVAGFGEAPPQLVGETIVDTSERFTVREFGAQVLAYPLRDFDGFVLGAELLSAKFSGTVNDTGQSVDIDGSALALGPFLGGKWIHESGFTLFGHLGVQRVWANADATALGHRASQSDSRWFPLVNLNVGWSF